MSTVAPPPGGRRERKKAQTRKLISDAATRMFVERGFDNVTVKQIADAADVSPTTVFKHFPVKESLVFDEAPDQQAGLVAAVTGRPPGRGVLDALQDYLISSRRYAHPGDPGLKAFLNLVETTPALRDYERQLLRRSEDALAAAIAETSDPPASPLAATALARSVLGALDLARDQPDFAAALTEIMDTLRHGWPERS